MLGVLFRVLLCGVVSLPEQDGADSNLVGAVDYGFLEVSGGAHRKDEGVWGQAEGGEVPQDVLLELVHSLELG